MKNPRMLGALASVLALAGCGGGGGGGGGDDGVVVINNLVRSAVVAPLATNNTTVQQLLANTTTVFSPVSSGVRVEDNAVALSAFGSISAVSRDANGNLNIVYTVDGDDQTVVFRPQDQDPISDEFTREVDGVTFVAEVADLTDSTLDYIGFLAAGRAEDDDNGFVSLGAFGPKTAAADLPTGTARYVGGVGGSVIARVGNTVETSSLAGNFAMNADFDNNTVGGSFTRIMTETANNTVEELGGFVSLRGEIDGNTFNGTLTEVNAPAGSELDGFSGAFAGDFYGPAAEEAGGVFNGTTSDGDALIGGFGGRR